ncbi:MAG: DNA polymerase III subunit epsilon [Cetobacterium sp.]
MRIVTLDTETTGFCRKRRNGASVCDGHRIVEIGCVEVVAGRKTGRKFHVYVYPGMGVDPKASGVHGITDEFLIGKPTFSEIVDEFVAFIGGAVIVIHNASFDIAFIDKEFGLLKVDKRPRLKFHVMDTLLLARGMFPGMSNTLDSLASRLGVAGRGAFHGALVDANLLASIYIVIFFRYEYEE